MGYTSRCGFYGRDVHQRESLCEQDLVSRLNLDDLAVNNGVLQVAHTIFKRWRPLYRSDALFTEINHVLAKFGEPFLVQLQVRGSSRTTPFLRDLSNRCVVGDRFSDPAQPIEQGDTGTAFRYSEPAHETSV